MPDPAPGDPWADLSGDSAESDLTNLEDWDFPDDAEDPEVVSE